MDLMYGADDKGECAICHGKMWMTLQPMNYVAPCLGCSGDRMLPDIEKERQMKLQRDQSGHWTEVPLQ
jgi:hypothetical protein